MKLAAVVVTFNRKELLIKTIESLKKQSRVLDSIYIIDNASTDGTYQYLVDNKVLEYEKFDTDKEYKQKIENITYIRMNSNEGGAGGFHEGIKIAHQEGNDWIWLMDDDVCPDKEALLNYEKFILNSEKEIGALMGVRFFEGTPFSFESKEHDFENWRNLEFKKATVTVEDIKSDKLIQIYDMPFEGPIINSRIIDKIGYPKKEFFIIGDDTDYSLRINQLAPIYMVPSVRIDRMINPYSDYVFGWKDFYTIRNIVYINKKYGKNKGVQNIRTLNLYLRSLLPAIKRAIIKRDISYIGKTMKIYEAYKSGMKEELGKKYLPGDF